LRRRSENRRGGEGEGKKTGKEIALRGNKLDVGLSSVSEFENS